MTMPHTGPPPPRPPRRLSADDVLAHRVVPDAYPFRYIYVTAAPSSGFRVTFAGPTEIAAAVDRVMAAAELLEQRGWEVVNFEEHGQVVYLRRRRS